MTDWPVVSFHVCGRLPSCQWKDASEQLCKAEAGWGERLCVRQAAQVQRATEREQLSIPRHCGQERGGVHARPALQPNDRQQRSDTRGESGNCTHCFTDYTCELHVHVFLSITFLCSSYALIPQLLQVTTSENVVSYKLPPAKQGFYKEGNY